MTKRIGESGNIFFTLFGAVALVGVIGVATSNLMRGPVGTVMKLNQIAKAESQLQIARKLTALEAAQQATTDCDSDGFLEPIPADAGAGACATIATDLGGIDAGAGCIPSSVGVSQNDPWGTRVGYCAWDHGPIINGVGCSSGMFGGTNGSSETVIAVISAGPDRTFDSSCSDDAGYVSESGDDIVLTWTYDDAIQGAGGLWALKSGDPDTAQTVDGRNIEVGGEAAFQSGARFASDVSFTGGNSSTLDLSLGTLLNLPDETALAVCSVANDRAVRIDTSVGMVLQICDWYGAGTWIDIGGSGAASSVYGADGDIQFNSGDTLFATDNFNYDFTNDRLRIGGNTAADDTLEVTGTADFSGDVEADNFESVSGTSPGNVGLAFNSAGNLGIYGSGSTVGLAVNGTSRFTVNGTGASVTGTLSAGDTTIQNTTINGTLNVTGDISDSGGAVVVNDDLIVNNSLEVGSNFAADAFILGTLAQNDGLYSDGADGLELRTQGSSRLTIDSAGVMSLNGTRVAADGDIGIALAGPPTTDLDIGGSLRLRTDAGAIAGAACTLGGSIAYTSGDELLICSDITNNWETIGTSGGGGGGGGGIWENGGGVIRLQPDEFSNTDDFVVGSLQLNDEGSGSEDERMFFENSTGSFRAGAATGTEWDTRGNYSIGLGYNTQATTANAIAIGNNAQARATDGLALGRDVTVAAGALQSMGIGLGIATGSDPQVTGTESLGIFMQDQSTVNFAASNTVGILGGRLMIDPNEPATQLATSGSLTVDVEGDVGAINFCSEDGTFCFTAEDVATGSTGAPGNDREMIFNSAGALATDTNFVFTSAGYFGVGTNTPASPMHIEGAASSGVLSRLSLIQAADRRAGYNGTFASGMSMSFNDNFSVWLGHYGTATGGVVTDSSFIISSNPDDPISPYDDKDFIIDNNDNIGLSVALPQARLDVDGTIKMSYGGEACDASRQGAIHFDSVGEDFYVCQDGATWQRIITTGGGAGTPAGGNDREIQFNSGGDLAGVANFVFTNTGNFGLGLANPDDVFDVVGSAQITGATVLGSSLDVTGQVNFSSGLNVAQATDLASTLNVTGASTLDGLLTTNGDSNLGGLVTFTSTGAVLMPVGDTAQQPSVPQNGMIRYNTDNGMFEAYQAGAWQDILTGAAATSVAGLTDTNITSLLDGQFLRYNSAASEWQNVTVSVSDLAGSAGNDREIFFNSGGTLGTDTGFVFTSAGRLGVGMAGETPISILHASGGTLMTAGYDRVATFEGVNHPVIQFKGHNDTDNSAFIGYDAQSTTEGLRFWTGIASDDNGGTSTAAMSITAANNVIIGQGLVVANTKLDVDGTIRMSYGGEACDASRQGAIHFDSAADKFYVCPAAGSWTEITTGGASASPAPGSDTQIVYNSGGVLYASSGFAFTSAGRVGIGGTAAANPQSDFHIDRSGSDAGIHISAQNGTYDPYISFLNGYAAQTDDWSIGRDDSNAGAFTISGDASLGTDNKLTILQGGDVGIGTTSPVFDLHVHNESANFVGARFTNGNSGSLDSDGFAVGLDMGTGSDGGFVWVRENLPLKFATNNTLRMRIESNGVVRFTSTGASVLNVGNTAQRPTTAENGMIRYNSDTDKFEAYQGGTWEDIITSAIGGGAADPNRGIQFKSGQGFAADANFVYTSAGYLGIGSPNPSSRLYIYEDYAADGYKTAMSVDMNTNGSAAAYRGIVGIQATATNDALGAGFKEAYGVYTVGRSGNDAVAQTAVGVASRVDVHAGDTGMIYTATDDGSSTGGTQYGLYIDLDDADVTSYGIFQASNNDNLLMGALGLGTQTPQSKLHAYNASGTAALLVEGDEGSTSDLNLLTSGDGASNVGDATATGWTFSARGDTFATASVQNDLMYYYWDGSAYQQRFLLENDTGNLVLSDTDVTGDTKLDVDGTIKMAYGGETCDAAREGAIHFDSAADKFYVCPVAGSWTEITTGGASASPAPGSDTQIIYNSGGVLYAQSGFVYTSAERLGIGTDTPNDPVHILANNPDIRLDFTGTPSGSNSEIKFLDQGAIGSRVFWDRASENFVIEGDMDSDGVGDIYITASNGAIAQFENSGLVRFNSSGATILNVGNTAQRPSLPENGMIRYNTDNGMFEAYQAGAWQDILTGAAATSVAGLTDTNITSLLDGQFLRYNSAASEWANVTVSVSDLAGNAGNDREVFFNSGGTLGTDTNFVFTSAGYMGLGTPAPDTRLSIAGEGVANGITLRDLNIYADSGTNNIAIGSAGTGRLFINAGNGDIYTLTGHGFSIDSQDAITFETDNGNNTGIGGTNELNFFVADSVTAKMRLTSAGQFGVGTLVPATALDVDGTIKMSYGGEACDASREGAIHFDSAADKFYVCPASGSWQEITTGGASSSPAPGANTQIVYNSGGVLYASSGLVFDNGEVGIGTGSPLVTLDVRTGIGSATLSLNGADNASGTVNMITSGTGVLGGTARGWTVFGRGDAFANATEVEDFGISYYDGAAWNRSLFIEHDTQNIGMNSNAPQTKLDVDGTIRMAYSGEACDANRIGAIHYDSGADRFYACQSASEGWVQLATNNATAADPQRGVQFKSGDNFAADANFVYTSAGRLGLGTSSPSQKFVVQDGLIFNYNTSDAAGLMAWGNGNGGQYSYLQLGDNVGGHNWGIRHEEGGADSNALDFSFNTVGLMTLTSAGQLGIGLSDPSAILDVAGTIQIADGGETCSAAADGGMVRWNGTVMQYCDGATWQDFASGATASPAAPDRGIQFNSGGAFTANANFVYTSAGRLGIGTAAPRGIVDINYAGGTGNTDVASVTIENTTLQGSSEIFLREFEAGGIPQGFKIRNFSNGAASINELRFIGESQFTSAGGNNWMAIGRDNGRVEIGSGLADGLAQLALLERRDSGTNSRDGLMFEYDGANNIFHIKTGFGGVNNFTERMTILRDTLGVGIGETAPDTALDIAGTLKIAYGGEACDASREGAIRYDSAADSFSFCATTANDWESITLGSGSLAALGDTNITSLLDGQFIRYDSATSDWVNVTIGVSDLAGNAGNDREIFFNSGGTLGTDTNFVFTSTGRFGVGTSAPGQDFVVADGYPVFQLVDTNDSKKFNLGYNSDVFRMSFTNVTTAQTFFMADYNTLNVGIKNVTPQTALDVNGTLKIAYGGEACDASREGAIRYDSAADTFSFCATNANGWETVSLGAGVTEIDDLTDAVTSYSSGSMYMGQGAGASVATGNETDNTFVGYNAGNLVNGSRQITILGSGAGSLGNVGSFNTLIGYYAGRDGPGTYNVMIGDSAGINATGGENIFIGSNVATRTTSGAQSIVLGYYAGGSASGANGARNNLTIMGYRAGQNLQPNANNNIFIGHRAGDTMTTGTGNLLIGNGVNAPMVTASNYINIGNVLYGSAGTGELFLGSAGTGGAVRLPTGGVATRPGDLAGTAAVNGMIRYNTTSDKFEAYQGGSWQDILTSAVAGGASAPDRGVQFNSGGNFAADANFTYTSDGDLLLSGAHTGTASVPLSGAGTRMFFDVQTSAFRVGRVTGAEWDNGSIGTHSIAMGRDTMASGNYSTALGLSTAASGAESTATGSSTIASGDRSTAIGYETIASGWISTAIGREVLVGDGTPGNGRGDNSVAFGLGNSTGGLHPQLTGQNAAGFFMGAQDGVVLSSSNTFGVFGGKMVIDPADPATNLSADAALEIEGSLKIAYGGEACDASREGAIHYDSGGDAFYVCRTAGSWDVLATGTPAAAAPDRGIQFNSGGSFTAASDFIYTAAGNLGVGISNPVGRLQVEGGDIVFLSNGGGNIGIGTNNPTSLLQLEQQDGSDLTLMSNNVAVSSNDLLGEINFGGSNEFPISGNIGAKIRVAATANLTTSDSPTKFEFYGINDNENTLTEWMNIENGSVAVGTNLPADGSAVLDLSAADKGFLPPRMTDPATDIMGEIAGLIAYSSGSNVLQYYNGSSWVDLVDASGSASAPDRGIQFNSGGDFAAASDFIYTGTGRIGLGTNTPDDLLDIEGISPDMRLTFADTPATGDATLSFASADNTLLGYVGYNADNQSLILNTDNDGDGVGRIQLITDNTMRMLVDDNGLIGIGTYSPRTDLDVDGTLKIAYDGEACDTNREGAIRYDSAADAFSFCAVQANGWEAISLGGGTLAALTDTIISGPADGDILYFSGADWVNNTLNLGNLGDVDTAGFADGNVLLYSAGAAGWVPGDAPLVGAFTDLTDTPADYTGQGGRFARVNSGETAIEFTNEIIRRVSGEPLPTAINLNDLGDVSASATDGQFLSYNSATGNWIAASIGAQGGLWTAGSGDDIYYASGSPRVGIGTTSPVATFDVAGDIKFASSSLACNVAGHEGAMQFGSGGTNIFEVCANSATGWEQLALGGTVAGALNDLSDVNTTGLVGGDVLLYSAGAGNWIPGNAPLVGAFTDLTDTPANYGGQAGRFARVNSGETALEFTDQIIESVSGQPAPNTINLNDLGDVSASATDGQYLSYNSASGTWVAATVSGGSGTPAGADSQIQFNSGGAFGATANFVYTSAGRMGIGSSAPSEMVSIFMNDDALSLRDTADGNNERIRLQIDAFSNGSISINNVGEQNVFWAGNDGTVLGGSDGAIIRDPGSSAIPNNVASAALHFDVASRGFLPPTNADPATNITSPATGLIAFDTTDSELQMYNGTVWTNIGATGSNIWSDSGAGYIEYSSTLGGMKVASVSGASAPTGAIRSNASLALGGLTDVTISGAANGEVLFYSAGASAWIDSTLTLTDLGNVDTTGFADGEVLLYSAGAGGWISGNVGSGSVTTAGNDRELQFNSGGSLGADTNLVYSAAGYLGVGTSAPSAEVDVSGDVNLSGYLNLGQIAGSAPTYVSSGFFALNELTDVDTAGYADGNVLLYSAGAGGWVVGTASGAASALNDLTDVDTTGFADGEVLLYSAGAGGWVPGAVGGSSLSAAGSNYQIQYNSGGEFGANANFVLSAAGYLGVGTSTPANEVEVSGDIRSDSLILNPVAGNAPTYTSLALDSLSDVDTAGVASGDVILYSGGSWVVGTAAAGGGASAINDLSDAVTNYASASMYVGQGVAAGSPTGADNTFFGYNSGNALTSGTANTVYGRDAGFSLTTGGSNSIFGKDAGRLMTTGARNTLFGINAGESIVGQGDNTLVGHNAGDASTGIRNTFLGSNAGGVHTSGDYNVYLGYNAGDVSQTGNSNIAIGYEVALPSAATSNYLNIGNAIYGENIYNASPEIGINNSAPAYTLDVTGDIHLTSSLVFEPVSGLGAPTYMSAGSLTLALNGLTDVNTAGFADGNVLLYSAGASSWVAGTASGGGGGAGAINDLSDATTQYSSGNMFIGQGTGAGVTTAENNTALGYNALASNGVSNYATAVGAYAAQNYNPGDQWQAIVAIGSEAARTLTSGRGITAVGNEALESFPGDRNTAIGNIALFASNGGGGSDNIGIGDSAGSYMAGAHNVVVGQSAFRGGFSGDYDHGGDNNVFIGSQSARDVQGSLTSNNVMIGYQTGLALRDGSSNILIGANVDVSGANAANELNIGDVIYGSGMYNATAHIGIMNSAPDVELDVTGDIEYTGTITDVSDRRLKTDITPLSADDVMARLAQIDTYSFRMKDDESGRIELGVMAQEVEKVFPELVKTADDEMGTKSVNYVGFVAPLIEATKELKAENEMLRAEIDDMKLAQARFEEDIMKEVKGLKAHTGYGIDKAQIGLWTIALLFGFSSVFFMVGGILRHRQRKQG